MLAWALKHRIFWVALLFGDLWFLKSLGRDDPSNPWFVKAVAALLLILCCLKIQGRKRNLFGG